MAKNQRNIPGDKIRDPASIKNNEHNEAAGSKKVSEVGRHLTAIPFNNAGTIAFTTNATTAKALNNKGMCLAVYNNAGAIGSITLGEDATVTVLAAGVTDAFGHVGIPCAPNAWTYIACAEQNFVIASAATLLVFIIDDNSYIKQEAVK